MVWDNVASRRYVEAWLLIRWLILCQAVESSGDEPEEPAKNEKESRMTTNKVEDQKDIALE
jgi:hypothetical protein